MGHTLRQLVKTATAAVANASKEQQIKIGKFNINYTKVGHGSHNVVMIPGALGTSRSHYQCQINGFNKEEFTLVIFDPQGYGKSVPPKRTLTKEGFQIDADTAYELMKYLDIPTYSVMGWSAGGVSSMLLAAQHPDEVKKLVIWGTHSFLNQDDIDNYRKIRNVSLWNKRIKQTMIDTYGEEEFRHLYNKWVDNVLNILEKEPDMCSDHLKNIICPTYILYGQKDKLVHPLHFPFLCHHIKNSKYSLYPEGQHDIHMEYPDDFNQKVQDFLLEQ